MITYNKRAISLEMLSVVPNGSDRRCWFGGWISKVSQTGLYIISLARSKTISETLYHLTEAGVDPKGIQ